MNGPTDPLVPEITVLAETRYVLEFPLLVSVILRNDTPDTDFLDLPWLDLLSPIDSLAVELRSATGGHLIRLGPSFTYKDEHLFRMELLSGQATRGVIDLTQLGHTFEAGHYQLSISICEAPGVFRSSPAVNVELIDPSPAERAEAMRLRRLALRQNAKDYGPWQPFLKSNWHTVSVAPVLGAMASRQLALHTLLHRAAYGPNPLPRFPLEPFRALEGPVLSAEAALLEYEIITLRGIAADAGDARARILQAWPELKLRLDRIDRGQGLLQVLRKGYGVESQIRRHEDPPPYTAPAAR